MAIPVALCCALWFGAGCAYAANAGTLPLLGIGAQATDSYQFDSGEYYLLREDGWRVSKTTHDADWNIHWEQDPDSQGGTLTLRDAEIKGTLYVPGGTTIRAEGTSTIEGMGAGIQVRTRDGGDLSLDIQGFLTVTSDIDALYNNGDGYGDLGGAIAISGAPGSSFTCIDKSSTSIFAAEGLTFGGSVNAVVSGGGKMRTGENAAIVMCDSAIVSVNAPVESGGDIRIEDGASFTYSTTSDYDLLFGSGSHFVVEKDATVSIDKPGHGIASFSGSALIEGDVSIKAGANRYSGIALGSNPGDYLTHGAGDVVVTGSLDISRGKNGIQNLYGCVQVKEGGSLTISNVDTAFLFPCGGGVYLDGGSIDVADVQKGVGSQMLANDKVIPCAIEVKNGSTLRMKTGSYLAVDQAPEGKPVMSFEFSDSTVELASGADTLTKVTQGKPLPLTTVYTKDCNVATGANADDATKRPLEGLSLDGACYLSIAPVGADWAQRAHKWSSAWSSNDTHHWHVCESSFCTLGDDITQMGGYAEHAFDTYQPNDDATCDEDGTETSTCACGKTHTRTDADSALGHSFGEWTVSKKPTCEATGLETRQCVRCDAAETRVVKALGHDFDAWTVAEEPTCTEQGEEQRTCSRCDAAEVRVVKALGHDFGAWAVTEQPTCIEQGSEQRECSRCDATETRVVKALGHDFDAWTVAEEPTCTEQGEEQRTCSRCDVAEHRAIEAMGHSFKDGACTACGLKDPSYKPAVKPGAPTDQGERLPQTGDPAGILFVALGGAGCLGAGAFASRRRHR